MSQIQLHASRRLRRSGRRGQAGITTAEYAVGTAAGCGLAGVLYKLLTGDLGQNLLSTLFDNVIKVFGWGG